ncbi:hypothetical protein DMN91_008392 [Ooceraea biroi]|uniref:Uncharacterized protein n=1 Tax=Ooceraea biroi TaxID=2015173 RepID=A0A3L8DI45_OOCBI|nr:hypothetical protein DMN91_008392 [Ooceraea biroi]
MKAQAQVGASLNALGSGLSDLFKIEGLLASPDGKAAVAKIAEGMHLLADHHFRLSQTRRAFIVPSLNFLGKTTSDSAPIDDSLFGSNFAQDVEAAQSIEKVARKMARKTPQSQQARQPAPHHPKQTNLPLRKVQQRQQQSENRKPPPRQTSSAHRARRDQHHSRPSHSRRSASRSRTRTRR